MKPDWGAWGIARLLCFAQIGLVACAVFIGKPQEALGVSLILPMFVLLCLRNLKPPEA